ncbi:MAG: hypothetical protein WCH04_18755 [Gammaproteobacteria bacterium]
MAAMFLILDKDKRWVRQTALKKFNVRQVLYPPMPQWPMRIVSGTLPTPSSGMFVTTSPGAGVATTADRSGFEIYQCMSRCFWYLM